MTDQLGDVSERLEALYTDLEARQMDALWRRHGNDPSPENATPPYQPYSWRGDEIKALMERAAALVEPGPQAERRVIILANPGLAPTKSATHTLVANVQMVLPGEIAPTHRHTPTAIRFVLEGSGASTIVDGEPVVMHPGDLVLTPAWSWHGHTNESNAPIIWMDGLDSPLVRLLYAGLYEKYPDQIQTPTKAADDSLSRFGSGHLRPVWAKPGGNVSPLMSFPWQQTEDALFRLSQVDADPFDDVALEYQNPLTGGHVLPTMACQIQMLRPGVHTQAHRHANSVVYHAFRGRGATIVDGVRFEWQQGDFVALPPWCWHEHQNESSLQEAILFSISDAPVYEALNLQREDAFERLDGHQPVLAEAQARQAAGVA
jgi:gentisate 1,2-dioxygenase